MAVPIKKIREMVLQALFSCDLAGESSLQQLGDLLQNELKVDGETIELVLERVRVIKQRQSEIDHLIDTTSIEYSLDRIQLVERNILRLSIYELLFDENIPPMVAISEAIRLARKFGTPEGGSFVNALLDKLHHSEKGKE